ncbi:pentapeptide repeats family protein [Burkholderia cepacia]|uniref:Pentapeptide repeats family protein n=1 Tax=Burkholderia cepacia TaxID=292 RepID=A0A0J5ZMQ8_BURCE|nr:pentapeptide repeat-containing protein [Burkholderia cepacia]KML54610.1 pentapeptide repeats family protein [Burkholderia cepacia]
MKIVKPDTLGLLYRTLRLDGADWLSVGALALFHLQADTSAGPANLATEVELWRTAQRSLGDHMPLDEGFPKPAGEFLVYGRAYARERKAGARTSIAVRARVGTACKERSLDVRDSAPLVDFHALPPSDRERARHLGSFDSRWLAKQWPHLPAGTHADYFHAAPLDQRIDAFWNGDEDIELLNMNAARPIIEGKLPRVRARCFVERSVDGFARIDACSMRAETVWLFPDAACGIVLFRSTVAIDDEDGDDVVRLIAGWESLDTSPLPVNAYVDPPLIENGHSRGAVAQALPETVAAPTVSADANVDTDADSGTNRESPSNPEPPVPDLSELEKAAAELAAQTDTLLSKHRLTQADIARLLPDRDSPANLSMDELATLAVKLEAHTEQLRLQCDGLMSDGAHIAAQPSGSEPHEASLNELLQQVDTQTRAVLEQTGLSRAQLHAISQSQPALAGISSALDILDAPLDVEALTAGVTKFAERDSTEPVGPTEPDQTPISTQPADAAGVFTSPAPFPPENTSSTTPAGKLTREQVIGHHQNKRGFAGLDLSDLDLSFISLERADFSGAILARTRFVGSRLSYASFDHAELQHADFSDTDLRGTKFENTSAPGASFCAAILDRALLDRSDFTGADFARASLIDCSCTHTLFDTSRMTALSAARLNGMNASFLGCKLDTADFTSASLPHANFQHASLRGATFEDAHCNDAEWQGAQASEANFRGTVLCGSRADASSYFNNTDLGGAVLDDVNWSGVDLRFSDLHKASLDRANLSHTNACGAILMLTSAKQIDLSKADLSHADLRHSNLFKASLRRAQLVGTQFQFSNLYGVDCYGTKLTHAQLEGANLDRTLLAVPGRPELSPAR